MENLEQQTTDTNIFISLEKEAVLNFLKKVKSKEELDSFKSQFEDAHDRRFNASIQQLQEEGKDIFTANDTLFEFENPIREEIRKLEIKFEIDEYGEKIEEVTEGVLTKDMVFNDPDVYYTIFLNWQKEPFLEGVRTLYEFVKKNQSLEPNLTPKYVFDTLVEKYNILIFHRYPPEILLDQVRNENVQKPYMLLLSLSKDERTAEGGGLEMLTAESKALYKTIHEQLKSNDMLLRIAEVDSAFDLKKILLTLDKKYGEKNKISMVLVNGHGGPNGLLVDPDTSIPKNKMYISSSNIKVAGEKYQRFFSENLVVLYNTCNSGYREDESKKGKEIAQRTSDTLNCTVIAPDTGMAGINQNSFKIERDPATGEISCHVDYLKSHYSFSDVPHTMIYENGDRKEQAA